MLKKTIAMLSTIAAGTYLPDDVQCFDKAEIDSLATLLAGLVYAPSSLRKALQEQGIAITRADFYSEVPTVAEFEASAAKPSKLILDKVFTDPDYLQEFLAQLNEFAPEFTPPHAEGNEASYFWDNGAFSYSDAMAYYCMIRMKKPKTIIEIGSGASTLVAAWLSRRMASEES